jgi:hypothetical protein
VGEIKWVRGRVVNISNGAKGIPFLDFCDDQAACPVYHGSFRFRFE